MSPNKLDLLSREQDQMEMISDAKLANVSFAMNRLSDKLKKPSEQLRWLRKTQYKMSQIPQGYILGSLAFLGGMLIAHAATRKI